MYFRFGDDTPGIASILFNLGARITECPRNRESTRIYSPWPVNFVSILINNSLGIALVDPTTSMLNSSLLDFVVGLMVSRDGFTNAIS